MRLVFPFRPFLVLFPLFLLFLILGLPTASRAVWKAEAPVTEHVPGEVLFSTHSKLILDSSGQPWTFYSYYGFDFWGWGGSWIDTRSNRWNGLSWDPMGPNYCSSSLSFLDAGQDSLGNVWMLAFCSALNADYLSRWNGSAWDPPLGVPFSAKEGARFAADSAGQLWLSFRDNLGNVNVQTWNGSSWQLRGSSLNAGFAGNSSAASDIVVDGSDQPWVFFACGASVALDEICYSHWNGGSWDPASLLTPMDGVLDSYGDAVTLAGGDPAVAFTQDDGTGLQKVYLRRWLAGAWTAMDMASSASSLFHSSPQLALDGAGGLGVVSSCQPVTQTPPLFLSFGDRQICFAHWDGAAWQPLEYTNLHDQALNSGPSLAYDSTGRPWVTWSQEDAPVFLGVFDSRVMWTSDIPGLTSTPTPTFSPTITASPTRTWSLSFTASRTATRTRTPTATATATWTLTATASDSPSATFTATQTTTPTASPSATRTSSPTPTDSPTRTWSPTASSTASPTGTGTLTATVTPTITPGAPAILDLAVYPNPVRDQRLTLSYRLTAPALRLRVFIFTASGRRILDLDLKIPDWGSVSRVDLTQGRALNLANGSYHYLLEMEPLSGEPIRRAGTFFVLR